MAQRAALLHASFKTYGGGERLALYAARALASRFETYVYTAEPPDRSYLRRMAPELERTLDAVEVVVVGSRVARVLEATGDLVRLWGVLDTEVFTDELENSHTSVILETFTSTPVAPAVYFHYPPPNLGSALGRLYERFVALWRRRLLKRIGGVRLALANSTWTAEGVRRAYGLEARVVYPPVDVEAFSEAAKGPHNEDIVVTVSRLGLGKGLDFIVDVASRMRDYEFYIVGESQKDTDRLIRLIRARSEALGVNNVHVLQDLPRDRLIELMSRSKAYLHPPFPEHFGIAVAEAAAAGLPTVVYRDGGAWTDIASRVDPALGYTTADEAVKALRHAVENRDSLAVKSLGLISSFTYTSFKEALLRALEEKRPTL